MSELTVTVVLALCVLGPICMELLTRKLFDSADEVRPEHFEFEKIAEHQSAGVTLSAGSDAPAVRTGR